MTRSFCRNIRSISCRGIIYRSTSRIGTTRISTWCSCTRCSASRCTCCRTLTINDFVATEFQCFFCLMTNRTVTISQSSGQGRHNFITTAAATVLADLVANFICCFCSNSFVCVIQSINECVHDFRIADTTVIVTQFVDGITSLLGITSCLRLVDQLSKFGCIDIAAFI